MFDEFKGSGKLGYTATCLHMWVWTFPNGHELSIFTDGNGHIINITEVSKEKND